MFIKKARAFLAIGAYLFGLIVFAGPHLYALLAWDWLVLIDPSTHRSRIDRWLMYWGCILGRISFWMLDIKIQFIIPEFDATWPMIVVSNHPSGPLDGIALQLAFQERIDPRGFRSIMKREVLRIPIVGRACKEAGSAFLTRGRDKKADLAEIVRCAFEASKDSRSILIFPEGTRFRVPREGSGFSRVLPPKSAGLRALVAAMPERMVLPITIVWPSTATNIGGMITSIASYIGSRVRVEASRLEEVDPMGVALWLQDEWLRKELLLTADD